MVIFGGLDTPVSMAMCRSGQPGRYRLSARGRPGTGITKNGANPNFAFRVSAVDEIVDVGMLELRQRSSRDDSPGLILVNNPWGRATKKGLTAAMPARA